MKRILRFYILYFYIKKLQYFLILLKISYSKSYSNFLFQLSPSQKLYLSFPRIKNKILPSIFLANKISIAQRNRVVVKLHPCDLTRFQLKETSNSSQKVTVSVAIPIWHYLDANRYHLLFRRQCWIEDGRGGWASFDEDSPIKDTKGNHEERYPLTQID